MEWRENTWIPKAKTSLCMHQRSVWIELQFLVSSPLSLFFTHSVSLTFHREWWKQTLIDTQKKMTEENGKVVLLNFRFSSHVPFFPIWNWSHRGKANKTMMEHVQTIISGIRLEWGRGTIGRIKHRANIFVFPLRKKNCQCFQILILLFGFSNQVF